MTAYRVYSLGTPNHRIVSVAVIEAANDEAAMSAARKLLSDHDLEIWTGSRRVGELRASPHR